MSTLSIVGIVLLTLIVVAGVLIKLRTRSMLKDMDGLSEVCIVPEDGSAERIVSPIK